MGTLATFKALQDAAYKTAKEHGWHDEQRTFGEYAALFTCEISEAVEEYRNQKPARYYVDESGEHSDFEDIPAGVKPEGIAYELADVIIRIMDYCGEADIDLFKCVMEKMEFNKTRSYRHGGKAL